MIVVGDHGQAVYSLAFAPDGTRLASAGKDGTARLWDLAGGAPLVLPHPDAAQAVDFDATGTRLATGCADGAIRLWDPADGRELHALAGEPGTGVCGLAFLAAGRLLVSASGQ